MAERFVLDTSLLIDYINGRPEADAYLDPLAVRDRVALHPVTIAEVLVGAHNRAELAMIDGVVRALPAVNVKAVDFEAAITLVRRLHLSHGLDWPDALIGATCLRAGLPLATLNDILRSSAA